MPEMTPPQDYSPSRIKYRLERIWLTPLYRSLLRTGVPIAIVVGLTVNHFLKDETQVQLAQSINNAWTMVEDRPEFAVKLMRITGATGTVAEDVRAAVLVEFPQSSMRLDLPSLKSQIEAVDSVMSADLFLRGGVLEVEVTERRPALIWRRHGHLELVDATGARAGIVENRAEHKDLPLILGEAAGEHAAEALDLIQAARPVAARLRGLRRMGERRWDVMLDRGQVIQLPSQNPKAALERVMALHIARDVLSRDVQVVDVRDGRVFQDLA